MSQYTREEILRMIQDNLGPERLDLKDSDLSKIDLSDDAIQKELAIWQQNNPGIAPPWYSLSTEGIDLEGVNLQKSEIFQANFRGSSLRGAILQEAQIAESNFQKADLTNANLRHAVLSKSQFQEVRLDNADLQQASIQETNLQNADISTANLKDAKLIKAILIESHLQYSSLERALLIETDLKKAMLTGANLKQANLIGVNLQQADLRETDFQDANLKGVDLQNADLMEANLKGADLNGANLQNAGLWGADLQGANLQGAKLQKAQLEGATLQKSELYQANLHEADLRRANLERVDLSGVDNISGVFWNNAILDRTRLKWQGLIPIGEEAAKEWEKAKEAYLILKDNFNDLGQYDYARECYIKEREMERKAHWPAWRPLKYHSEEFKDIQSHSLGDRFRRLRLYLKYTSRGDVWTWTVLTFFKLTSTYGQRVKNVLASGLLWIVLFAFLYPMAGVVPLPTGQDVISWRSLINSLPSSLIYSVASFATLQLTVGYTVDTPVAQLLTSAEALIGIIWLAYFVYAFTNMMRSS